MTSPLVLLSTGFCHVARWQMTLDQVLRNLCRRRTALKSLSAPLTGQSLGCQSLASRTRKEMPVSVGGLSLHSVKTDLHDFISEFSRVCLLEDGASSEKSGSGQGRIRR